MQSEGLPLMDQSRSKILLAALFSAVLASGCTSGPSPSDIQSQAEETQDQVMERMQQNAISMDIAAVFESDGEIVLQVRNTGTKTVSTGNLSVSTDPQDSECRPVEDLPPTSLYDCETSIDFPETGKTVLLELENREKSLDTYNCTVESEESVAC